MVQETLITLMLLLLFLAAPTRDLAIVQDFCLHKGRAARNGLKTKKTKKTSSTLFGSWSQDDLVKLLNFVSVTLAFSYCGALELVCFYALSAYVRPPQLNVQLYVVIFCQHLPSENPHLHVRGHGSRPAPLRVGRETFLLRQPNTFSLCRSCSGLPE